MKFTKVGEGQLDGKQLESNDVFIVDCDVQVWIWIGKNASVGEKSQSMKFAVDYLKQHNKPASTPITRINEGQTNHIFSSLFTGGVGPGSATAGAPGAKSKPRSTFCAVM